MRAQEFVTEPKLVDVDGIKLAVKADTVSVYVRALASDGARELGHVYFDRNGSTLVADELKVHERFRGQGIAKIMYDYVKSMGFEIKRSADQTDDGRAFWDRNRGSQGKVWEDQTSSTPTSAGCIIVAADTGRWCLQQRSNTVSDPGVWSTWGGGSEPGETLPQTVRRELAEESGYTGPVQLELVDSRPEYATFVALVPHEFEPQINSECQDWCWCEPDQLPEPLHPGLAQLLTQSLSENTNSYHEIEFVCANPDFCDATDPEQQQQLRQLLQRIPGVITVYQDQSDYSAGQFSLSAIYQTADQQRQIVRAAKKLGVAVDLARPVDDDYVDRAVRGELEGQIQENRSFNRCYDRACQLYDRAEAKGIDATLLQVADYQGDGSDADARWQRLPQRVWQHYVTVIGDTVLDPTAEQFGAGRPKKYNVDELKSQWGKIYTIRSTAVNENFADGKVKGKSRPGRFKRAGVSCTGSVTSLRKKAKNSSGERQKGFHWCANMKSGRNKNK